MCEKVYAYVYFVQRWYCGECTHQMTHLMVLVEIFLSFILGLFPSRKDDVVCRGVPELLIHKTKTIPIKVATVVMICCSFLVLSICPISKILTVQLPAVLYMYSHSQPPFWKTKIIFMNHFVLQNLTHRHHLATLQFSHT